MTDTEKAFKNITNAMVTQFGDVCKADLILIGIKIGHSESDLREHYPALFTTGDEGDNHGDPEEEEKEENYEVDLNEEESETEEEKEEKY